MTVRGVTQADIRIKDACVELKVFLRSRPRRSPPGLDEPSIVAKIEFAINMFADLFHRIRSYRKRRVHRRFFEDWLHWLK